MDYLIGVIVVLAVYGICKFANLAKPTGFAKSIARVQLISFYAFRESEPNATPEQQYSQAIATRSSVGEDKAIQIVNDAKKLAEGERVELRFWNVVLQLVALEYWSKMDRDPTPVMRQLAEGVMAVIPEDL